MNLLQYYLDLSIKTKLVLFVACFSLWLGFVGLIGALNAKNATVALYIAAISAVAVALACIFGTLIGHSIIHPLEKFKKAVAAIADGDLAHPLAVTSKDDMGRLARDLNTMTASIANMVAIISQNSLRIAASAEQLHTSSTQIANGAQEITSRVTNLVTASEEMNATSEEIAQTCQTASSDAVMVTATAQTGEEAVRETTRIMAGIAGQVTETANTVAELGERSDQIGVIVSTIEDIADQTNLLALNAAIEAARAGEQGRGFAVVADEVRKLAERTSLATREIATMITGVQQETHKIVASMQEGVTRVETGSTEVVKSGSVLSEIIAEIAELQEQVTHIATAAEQQTATTGEVTRTIHTISEIVTDAAKQTQNSSDAAEQLSELATGLMKQVERFKVGAAANTALIQTARSDHRIFVTRLERALADEIALKVEGMPSHLNCRFGKWYYGPGKEACAHLPAYRSIEVPHEKIHGLAIEAIHAKERGDKAEAARLIKEVVTISRTIDSCLEKLGSEYDKDIAA